MSQPSVIHDTFVLERSYPKPPQAVFAAFADPAKKRRWFAESRDHGLDSFEMDFRPGGGERVRYRLGEQTPFPGAVIDNQGVYQEIAPDQRIVLTQTMDLEGRRFSVALITFELAPTAAGTQLTCTHHAVFLEGADGPQMRQAGWRELLDRLAQAL